MENIKSYNEFINESVRDFLKPKSTEEILKSLGDLTPYELLIKSVKNNFVEGVKIALKNGADPSADNNYAIKWSSTKGYTEIVKLLLQDKRVDPSYFDNWSIRWSSLNGHTEVVKLLLQDKRVDPSDNNNSAIKNASLNRYIEVVKLLLEDRRVKEKLTENEIKKFERQIKNLNESVRDFLKPKSTEDILRDLGDLNPKKLLIKSAKNGFVEGVKLALERGADPSVDNNYVIRYASQKGHLEVIKLLLDDPRVDPSAGYNESIKLASGNGHVEVVKLLLQDKRVDPSTFDNWSIRIASYNGHLEVVKLLLQDKRVDPSVDNNSGIQYASQNGHIEIVKLLLQDKRVREKLPKYKIKKFERQIINLNESVRDLMKPKSTEEILKSLGDLTPNELLIKSVRNGFVEGVRIALERGADPSVDDNYTIQFASEHGHTEIVKLLLEDPRVDPSDWYNAAIKYASTNGYIEIVKLLLEDKRVNPSAENNYVIRYASEKGHIEVVKLLLNDKRVNPSAINNYAIRYSSRNGHIEVVKLLLQDKRVIEKLSENEIKKYEEQIKDL